MKKCQLCKADCKGNIVAYEGTNQLYFCSVDHKEKYTR